tara:strand:+ start:8089 stop:8454 length:366 start_codon:yes stop_codon:yes gene_type:complete
MAYDTDYYTNAYLVLEGYQKEMTPASETKAAINFTPLGIPTIMPATVKLAGLFEEAAVTQPEVPPGETDTTIETGGCEESSAALTAEGEAALGVLATGGGVSSFQITTGGGGGTGGGTGGY